MLEWLNVHIAYWHWLVFGLCLALAEIMLVSFVALWFGLAAIIVGLLLWLVPFSFTLQLLIWIILSLFIVFAWFKWVSPHFKNKTFSVNTIITIAIDRGTKGVDALGLYLLC